MPDPQPSIVNMVDSGGQLVGVPSYQVDQAAAQGYRPETPQEAELRRYHQDAGAIEGLKAFGEGAASGLTLGGSEYIAGQLASPEYKRAALLRQQEFEDAYMGGQIAGALAPAIFTGGESAIATGANMARGAEMAATAGRLATAPARAVTALAGGAGRAVERAIAGEGAGVARSIFATGGRLATEGAVEGYVQGVGQRIGQASLGDEDLTWQQIHAAGEDGALLGGLASLGLGGATMAVGKALPKLSELGVDVRGSLQREANAQTLKGYTSGNASDFQRVLGPNPEARAAQLAERVRTELGGAELQTLETKTDAIGQKRAESWERLAQSVQDAEKAGARVDGERLAARLRDEVLDPLKHGIGAERKVGKAIERDYLDTLLGTQRSELSAEGRKLVRRASTEAADLETKLAKASERLDELSGKLADAGEDAGPKLRTAYDKQQAIVDRLRESHDAARGRIDALTAEHTQGPRQLSIEELREVRKKIDAAAQYGSNPASGVTAEKLQALRQARSIVEEEIDGAMRTAAPEAQAAYREAKSAYSDWATLDKIATKRVKAETGLRAISFTDAVLGAGGVAMAGPTAGLAMAGVNKALRSSAASALAGRVLNSVAGIGATRAAADAARQTISQYSARAVAGRLLKSVPRTAVPRTVVAYDRLQQRAEDIRRDRQAVIAEMSARLGALQGVGRMAAVATMHQVGVASYLADQLPQTPVPRGGLLGVRQTPPASAMAEWRAKARAATKPLTVLEDMRDGALRPEAVAAVEATSPKLLEQMRAEVAAELDRHQARGRAPDAQARQQLAILLGRPVDARQDPGFVADVQAGYSGTGEANAAEPEEAAVRAAAAGRVGFAERLSRRSEVGA